MRWSMLLLVLALSATGGSGCGWGAVGLSRRHAPWQGLGRAAGLDQAFLSDSAAPALPALCVAVADTAWRPSPPQLPFALPCLPQAPSPLAVCKTVRLVWAE